MDERIQAQELVREHITSPTLLTHIYATEAIMRALANRLGQDALKWALAGLLHDIDSEHTAQTPERHGAAGADMLGMLGFDEEITHAVLSHAMTGEPRTSLLDHALYAAVPATDLLLACAALPGQPLEALTPSAVCARFADSAFAPEIDRAAIDACTQVGLTREAFLALALTAMQDDAQHPKP